MNLSDGERLILAMLCDIHKALNLKGAIDPDTLKPLILEAGSNGAQTEGGATIAAPMLGMFYRASAPGEEPFVEVGSKVGPDTVVGLIEVMKMMNAVPAGITGTIVEACVENAQLVEDGAPLFRIRSDR